MNLFLRDAAGVRLVRARPVRGRHMAGRTVATRAVVARQRVTHHTAGAGESIVFQEENKERRLVGVAVMATIAVTAAGLRLVAQPVQQPLPAIPAVSNGAASIGRRDRSGDGLGWV